MNLIAQLTAAVAVVLVILAAVETGKGTRARLEILWLFSAMAWPYVVLVAVAPALLGSPDRVSGLVLGLLSNGPTVAIGLLMGVRAIARGARRIAPATAVLIAGSLALAPLVSADPLRAGFAVALFLPTVLESPRSDVLEIVGRAARLSIASLIAAIAAAYLLAPAVSLGACRDDKCGLAGVALHSAFSGNGNIHGIVLVLLLPLAVAGVKRWRAIAIAAAVVLISDTALSRAAYVGLGIALVLLLASLVGLPERFVRALSMTALVVAAAAGTFPLWTRLTDSDFTYRGVLWIRALDLIRQSPLFGWGPTYWGDIGQTTELDPSYSPHNQWLEILVAGGVLGLVGFFLILVLVIRSVHRDDSATVTTFLAVSLGVGIVEVPFQPWSLGITPFTMLVLLFIASRSGSTTMKTRVERRERVEGLP